MSAMSMRTATFFGSSGLTNVRMFVTPSGPNTSSRFGEASQWSVSLTSWCPITVGIPSPLVHGAARSQHPKAEHMPVPRPTPTAIRRGSSGVGDSLAADRTVVRGMTLRDSSLGAASALALVAAAPVWTARNLGTPPGHPNAFVQGALVNAHGTAVAVGAEGAGTGRSRTQAFVW